MYMYTGPIHAKEAPHFWPLRLAQSAEGVRRWPAGVVVTLLVVCGIKGEWHVEL